MKQPADELLIGALRISIARKDIVRSDGTRPKLAPKVFQLLLYLSERAGQIISREQIFQDVWKGRVVEANTLTQVIFQARLALGDHQHTILETLPKRGIVLNLPDTRLPGDLPQHAVDNRQKTPIAVELTTLPQDQQDTEAAQRVNGSSDKSILEHSNVASELPVSSLSAKSPERRDSTDAREQPPSAKKRGSTSSWGLGLGFGLCLCALIYALGVPKVSTTEPAAQSEILLSADLDPEIKTLFAAAARGAGMQAAIVEQPPENLSRQFYVGRAPEAEGIHIRSQKSEDYYSESQSLLAFLSLLFNGSDPSRPFDSWDLTSDEASPIDNLFQSGVAYTHAFSELARAIERHPRRLVLWLEAERLMRLAGKNDVSALLKLRTKFEDLAPSGGKALWLIDAIRAGRRFVEVSIEADRLRENCADLRIGRNSWMHGACLLEQGSSERRASRTNEMQATYALAAAAFRSAQDEDSATLVDTVLKISYQPTSVEYTNTHVKREDARVLGVLLQPVLYHNPNLAYAMAERLSLKDWVRADAIASVDVFLAMSNAARMLDDDKKLAHVTKLIDRYTRESEVGSGKSMALSALMDLYFSQGEIGKFLKVRRQLGERPQDIRVNALCRSAFLMIETGINPAIENDLENCLTRANDRFHYSHFVEFYGRAGKIAVKRLSGSLKEAAAQLQESFDRYKSMLADQSIDAKAHQAVASGMLLFSEAWALERWDLIEEICTLQPAACVAEPMASIKKSKTNPAELKAIEILPAKDVKSAPEFLVQLHLEQIRTGKCPLSTGQIEEYRSTFEGRGNRLSVDLLSEMKQDCLSGGISKVLQSYPSRMTY